MQKPLIPEGVMAKREFVIDFPLVCRVMTSAGNAALLLEVYAFTLSSNSLFLLAGFPLKGMQLSY
jgi:hypothetical protein